MTRSIRHAAATGRSLKHNGTPSISLKMFMHSVEISPRFSTIFCRSGKHTFRLGLGPQRVFGFRWNECEACRRDPSSEPCLLVYDAISCNRGGQQNCFIRKGPYPELGLHAVAKASEYAASEPHMITLKFFVHLLVGCQLLKRHRFGIRGESLGYMGFRVFRSV